jgi:hypothetical protein
MKTIEDYEQILQKIAACADTDVEKNPYLLWLNNSKPDELGAHLSFVFYLRKLIQDFYQK